MLWGLLRGWQQILMLPTEPHMNKVALCSAYTSSRQKLMHTAIPETWGQVLRFLLYSDLNLLVTLSGPLKEVLPA